MKNLLYVTDTKRVIFHLMAYFYLIFASKYSPGDQIKKNEIGRAYSMYGRKERCTQNFVRET